MYLKSGKLFLLLTICVVGFAADALEVDSTGKVTIAEDATLQKDLQVNGSLKIGTGASVNEISTDGSLTDDSDTAVPTEKAVKSYVDSQASAGIPDVIIQDQKAANATGGTFTSGAWRTRDLNAEVRDVNNICTLSANQFTLPAGTYYIEAESDAYRVDRHKLKLRNVSASSDAIIGHSEYANVDGIVSHKASLKGVITITTTQTFEIQHRCGTTKTVRGFGVESNFGVVEVFSTVCIWKQ